MDVQAFEIHSGNKLSVLLTGRRRKGRVLKPEVYAVEGALKNVFFIRVGSLSCSV